MKVTSQAAWNEASNLARAVQITHAMKTATSKLAAYTYQIDCLISVNKCLLRRKHPGVNKNFKKVYNKD